MTITFPLSVPNLELEADVGGDADLIVTGSLVWTSGTVGSGRTRSVSGVADDLPNLEYAGA
jgi:hypothetical protein